MKQIFQDLSNGKTTIVESPVPEVKQNTVLVNTVVSLISAGTERSLVNFGKASFLNKARQQPEKVKMVLEKVGTDGLITTLEAVNSKLGQPIPLGYCNIGVVSAVPIGSYEFKPGDRVVSNGPHADVVRVSKKLCVRIPDEVDNEEAAFTVVASIGLQGIRLIEPRLGEAVAVIGVGLIGLLTVQLLLAQGCRVLAIDFDEQNLELAKMFGAEVCYLGKGEEPVAAGMAHSRGHGMDAVIITASSKSNDPVTQAARMSRKRGRIVLVGVVGLELNRSDFYEKELSFQVSCSYGPGRYDQNYEEDGHDYPFGFVRWTEQRNFEAILDMMASNRIDVRPLITHQVQFEDAPAAYDILTNDRISLGILLKYHSEISERHNRHTLINEDMQRDPDIPVVGFIGAGNYASRVLMPAFAKAGAKLHTVSTAGSASGVVHGKKNGFITATTDVKGLLATKEINSIVIVTQHSTHAEFVVQALQAGKHVFVEKPLAISTNELASIKEAYQRTSGDQLLMVGFNRRFSPQVIRMKGLLETVKESKSFVITVNAGAIPADHWTQKTAIGGGRIIGEACHFIDLMRFLADSQIKTVHARRIGDSLGLDVTEDKVVILLSFHDGSFGTINYFANGALSFPKERVEVFAAGRVLQLDNFRKLRGYGWPGFRKMNLWKQDKGQTACVAAYLSAIQIGKLAPIPADQLFEVAQATIDAAVMVRNQT